MPPPPQGFGEEAAGGLVTALLASLGPARKLTKDRQSAPHLGEGRLVGYYHDSDSPGGRLIRLADVGKFEEEVLGSDSRHIYEACETPPEELLGNALWSQLAEAVNEGCLPADVTVTPQRWVTVAGGRRFRPDFVLSLGVARLCVECDGWAYHRATLAQRRRDMERDQLLDEAGFDVQRFPAGQIKREPGACAEAALRRFAFIMRREGVV